MKRLANNSILLFCLWLINCAEAPTEVIRYVPADTLYVLITEDSLNYDRISGGYSAYILWLEGKQEFQMKFGFAVVPTDATNLPDSVWFTGTVFGTGGDSDALTDVYEKLTALAEPEDDWQYLQKVHGEVYGNRVYEYSQAYNDLLIGGSFTAK